MATGGSVAQYRHDRERRGLQPRSIEKVDSGIRSFARWYGGDPLDATEDDVQRFLDGKRICPRTRYYWLSILHSYYAWAIRHGHTDRDPTSLIDRPKLRRTLPRPIADADLSVGLALATTLMRAWLSLAAFSGLRCAEIADLTRDSILESQGLLRVLGKGGTERLVPLHPAVWDALRSYGLPARAGAVFVQANGVQWSPVGVSRAVALYFDDIGIDSTAHQLRHWFGTRTYAACTDLLVVQNLMGHASPSTTAIYVAFSPTVATAAVFALSVT